MKSDVKKILRDEERKILGTSIWEHRWLHWLAPRPKCYLCKKRRRARVRKLLMDALQKATEIDPDMAVLETAGLFMNLPFDQTLKARKIVIDGLALQLEILNHNEWKFLKLEFDEWVRRGCPIAEWPE
jgi:hypothetical protein